MKLYNSMSRRKEEFVPLVAGQVGFYVCGPTVYNDIHIGNARTFISFDMIRRYLEYSGYKVRFVQNITDVDDKIIRRAQDEGRRPDEVATQYAQAFIDSMRALGVADPTVRPRATEEIEAMVELVSCLVAKGHAYEVDGDVYFSVRSFSQYGVLSGRDIDQLQAGARVEPDERKHDPLDFALWKAAKTGEPFWESPWGPGRPGWHLECSAMSQRYLGCTFDIHGGGEDLIFPHHENEIAQSEACHQAGFARYWLHGGMLTLDAEKMSKSEGNSLFLKDVLRQVPAAALRLLMAQTHYRSPFDYSAERLDEAASALQRIESVLRNVAWRLGQTALAAGGPTSQAAASAAPPTEQGGRSGIPAASDTAAKLRTQTAACRTRFVEQMDDDFNSAAAVAAIYGLVTAVNVALAAADDTLELLAALQEAAEAIQELLAVLGVVLAAASDDQQPALPVGLVLLAEQLAAYNGGDPVEAAEALLALRGEARAHKDWPLADAVRDGLTALGLAVEDTALGTRVVLVSRDQGECR
ncbi:MAG: cysteine--tRNA ligase [Actinomycetia bacterium]|nr:cysteine--tRNA ligase [Actinomycetes bacterium]